MQNKETTLRSKAGACVVQLVHLSLLSVLLLIDPQLALSQAAPEVIFRAVHLGGDCSVQSAPVLLSSSGQSDSGSWSAGEYTYTEASSATASSGTLSLNVGMTVARTALTTGGSQCSGYGFEVYTKHPADMVLTGSGSASGSFTNGASGLMGFGTYPINGGTYGLSQSGGQSGTTSGGGNLNVNLSCSTSGAPFAEYPGVNYYRAFQSNGQLYKVSGTVTLGGTGAASGTINGTGSLSVAYATSIPVAKIGPAEPGATTGYAVTLTNQSYDPDGPGGNQATCSAVWTITGPLGAVTPSAQSNSSVTFTPSVNGPYTVSLLVTDNEGDQSTTSVTFNSRGATGPLPGSYGRTETKSISCGGSPGNGGSPGGMSAAPGGKSFTAIVNLMTGNAAVTMNDPIRTRGFPLRFDFQINNQIKFAQRKTALGNADFTYSMAVYYHSYLNANGSQIKERYLIDSDGTAIFIGSGWTGTPTTPSYFKGNLQSNTLLTNAGPPGKISYAGNYKYEFNSGGGLTKITDPQGNVQQVTNDSNYRIATVTDQSTGKTLTFLYSGSSMRAYRVVENGGESNIDFTYSNDRITSVKVKNSALGVESQLDVTYNGQGLVSTVQKDGDTASTLAYTYYTQGNGVALGNISWAGGGTRINYFGVPGAGGWARSVLTDSNGNKTSTDYDANLLAVRKVLPTMNGASSPPTYTFANNTTDYTTTAVSDGATTTNFTYNSKAKVTQVNNNAGGVWNFTYASNGINLTGASDSIGTLLTLVYGNSSLPNLPTSITGADGKTWTRTYNSYGQILTEVPPAGSPTGTTTYTYEETAGSPNKGMLKTVTNGAGNVTQFTGYTSLGDVTSVVQTPETGTNITTSFTYDGAQRVLSETQPDGKQRSYSYNYRKLASITDEAGNSTAFSFCSICGKMSGLTAPLSKSLSWQEDGDHRTTGFTDARSNQTQYQYGNAGELKKTLYPDGSYKLYRYDNYGRLAETEDTRGNTQSYTYDTAGRVQTIMLTPSGGTGVALTYAYNSDDTVSSVTDEVGTTNYSYTGGRHVSNVAYDWSASGLSTTQNVAYTYSNDGTLDTLTWKNGTITVASWDYGYDGAGRVTSVVNGFGETTSFTYDGVGKLKTQTNQNGTSLTYSWNQQRGWPTQILHKAGSTPFAQYDLVYDGGSNTVGNITEVTELDGSVVDYTYDGLYRLTAEARTGTGPYTRSYGYDLAGNLTTYGGSAFASYDNSNKISSLAGGSISYDADGNTTAVSGGGIPATTLTWDTRNKLLRQQTSTNDLSYSYDHTGRRVLRWPTGTSGQQTFYVFSGDTVIGEVFNGSAAYAYTWGSKRLVSLRAIGSGQSLWHHFGPQNETRYLTDTGGSIADSYRYDGYGSRTYSSGSNVNPFMYGGGVGYYSDGIAGLVLSTQRWLSPELTRWMSRDPIAYEGGDNLYNYVLNRPTFYQDPTGLSPEDVQKLLDYAKSYQEMLDREGSRISPGWKNDMCLWGSAIGACDASYWGCVDQEKELRQDLTADIKSGKVKLDDDWIIIQNGRLFPPHTWTEAVPVNSSDPTVKLDIWKPDIRPMYE